MMGEPLCILQASWSISSVHFDSIVGVEGKNLTYGICEVKENDSCIPAEVMQTAGISDLDLVGVGNSFASAGYSYAFDAGVMKAPGLRNEYGVGTEYAKYVDFNLFKSYWSEKNQNSMYVRCVRKNK